MSAEDPYWKEINSSSSELMSQAASIEDVVESASDQERPAGAGTGAPSKAATRDKSNSATLL